MRTFVPVAALPLALSLGFLAPAWVMRGGGAGSLAPTPSARITAPRVESFATAVNQAGPCVVTIVWNKASSDIDDALDEGRSGGMHGVGSGVILRADGHILTNAHVIDAAENLRVVLSDGRSLPGQVMGVDPSSDLAVVKVDAGAPLPVMLLADSAQVQVGDCVLALGNPFGIGPTVSLGIVSAIGRDLGFSDFEDYLQTDASINMGCSGGALVDSQGRLIGINTAIFTPHGMNMGIGFAISSNLANYVANELITHGRVVRGAFGLVVSRVDAEHARTGARVVSLVDGGPAASAGLCRDDVVVAVNGTNVSGPQHLQLLAAKCPPGTATRLDVVRAGHEVRLELQAADRSTQPQHEAAPPKPALGVESALAVRSVFVL